MKGYQITVRLTGHGLITLLSPQFASLCHLLLPPLWTVSLPITWEGGVEGVGQRERESPPIWQQPYTVCWGIINFVSCVTVKRTWNLQTRANMILLKLTTIPLMMLAGGRVSGKTHPFCLLAVFGSVTLNLFLSLASFLPSCPSLRVPYLAVARTFEKIEEDSGRWDFHLQLGRYFI